MLTDVIRDLNNGLDRFMYGSPHVSLLAPNQIAISNLSNISPKAHKNLCNEAKRILKKHSLNYLFLERRSGGYIVAAYNTPQEQYDANIVKLTLLMEYELELQKPILKLKKEMLEVVEHLRKLKSKGNKNDTN